VLCIVHDGIKIIGQIEYKLIPASGFIKFAKERCKRESERAESKK
jgi:hypothetical protein